MLFVEKLFFRNALSTRAAPPAVKYLFDDTHNRQSSKDPLLLFRRKTPINALASFIDNSPRPAANGSQISWIICCRWLGFKELIPLNTSLVSKYTG